MAVVIDAPSVTEMNDDTRKRIADVIGLCVSRGTVSRQNRLMGGKGRFFPFVCIKIGIFIRIRVRNSLTWTSFSIYMCHHILD